MPFNILFHGVVLKIGVQVLTELDGSHVTHRLPLLFVSGNQGGFLHRLAMYIKGLSRDS
jgi:hypothetical protein